LRSYKDDTSFYDVWIDIYYNLNFINLNKQLMSEENETDLAVVLNSVDKDFTFGSNEDDTRETAKVLSNYESFRSSSLSPKSDLTKSLEKKERFLFEILVERFLNL